MEPKLVCTQSQSWNKKKGDKIGVKGKKISGQTLTHWGKYLDQNQEVDFQLELVQSSKWRSEKGKKGKRGQIKREKNCIVSTNTENERSMKKHLQGWMGMKKACNPTVTKQKRKKLHTSVHC